MKRKLIVIVAMMFAVVSVFAQSAEYSKYLAKAKAYESKKQWAFALEAWYDAIGCEDEPSVKADAMNGYLALSEAIKSGNPGLGKYNAFTLHDEWKKLLIDAEKLGSSICKFELHLGKLEQGELDYKTKTASYKSKVQVKISDRYAKTIDVVKEGYKAARKSDWKDLPKAGEWPLYSVSSAKNAVYDVGGAKILEAPSEYKNQSSEYYNAFSVDCTLGYFAPPQIHCSFRNSAGNGRGLYDYKFNIVDKNGKELVKGKRWLLSYEKIVFEGVSPAVMDLIDNGKAFLNPVAVYLEYGKYNYADEKEGRSFIKKFPETQLDLSKAVIYCWNRPQDLNASRFSEMFYLNITKPLVQTYFEKISANGAVDEEKLDKNALPTLFKIPLDEAYTYESGIGRQFNLTDDFGRTWKIKEDDFFATLKEITNQEYSINPYSSHPYYLQRSATAEEKTEYGKYRDSAEREAVKLYFEKISVNGRIVEHMGYDSFDIPLDRPHYDDYGRFNLEDSTGKTWRIGRDDFLRILKELTNQEYSISYDSLSRNLTEEDKNHRKNSEAEAVKLYFEKISVNGRIVERTGEDSFEIPLDSAYDGAVQGGVFDLKDSSGKSWRISSADFLKILKELTNQEYSISKILSGRLTRTLTEKEKAEYKKQKK